MSIAIRRGGLADLASLEPLWLSVHRHHAAAMPELSPYMSNEASWSFRSALYRELLGEPATVLLLARTDSKLIGYGLARVLPAEETWLADTWTTGRSIGEIESLSVSPSFRGHGVGSALLQGLSGALAKGGVSDLVVGALAGNLDAIRLYEKNGYRPTWIYLSRLEGRANDT